MPLPALIVAMLLPFSAGAGVLLLARPAHAHKTTDWRQPLAWLMLVWLIWLPASLAWGLTIGYAQTQLAVLLCLPLAWWAGSRAGLGLGRHLTWALPTLLVVLAIWSVLQGPGTYTGKPQGPFNDPNALAAILNLLLLPLLARWLSTDLKSLATTQRTALLAMIGGSLFVLFLIASRGATLALLLVVPFLLWMSGRTPDSHRKWGSLVVTTLAAFAAAWITSGGLNVAGRLAETVQQGDGVRWLLLKSAWAMALDHPWLGTGLGSFRLLYARYRFPEETGTAGGWVHNDYLQLWVEAGLPMLLLLLALVGWVALRGWRTLREDSPEALERMGYLAAIAAVLIHANFNFLLYFAPIALLLGLYLARVQVEPALDSRFRGNDEPGGSARALRLAGRGYALVLGWLFLGLVASEVLIGQEQFIQRQLLRWGIPYPRYEVASWLARLSPYNPAPRHTMALELASVVNLGGANRESIRTEALDQMEQSQRLVPCYLPYASDALNLLSEGPHDRPASERAWPIIDRSLDCNPRHGLTYYYAGRLVTDPAVSDLTWWQAGLAASTTRGEKLLLAAMVLSREFPENEVKLRELAANMASALRFAESHPGTHMNQGFWTDAQHKLYRWGGQRYLELVPQPKQ